MKGKKSNKNLLDIIIIILMNIITSVVYK